MTRLCNLLAPFFALVLVGCAGAMPVPEDKATVQQVYPVPGAQQDQIFRAARTWIAETFNSAKAVIEYESREEGTLIGNGIIRMPCDGLTCLAERDTRVKFTMRLDVKPEKFRLTFTNILVVRRTYSDGMPPLQGDFDLIKADLLAFGPGITQKLAAGDATKDF